MLVYNNRKTLEDTAGGQQRGWSRPEFANYQLSLMKICLSPPFPIKIEGRALSSLVITCLQFKGIAPEALVKTALELKLEKIGESLHLKGAEKEKFTILNFLTSVHSEKK